MRENGGKKIQISTYLDTIFDTIIYNKLIINFKLNPCRTRTQQKNDRKAKKRSLRNKSCQ